MATILVTGATGTVGHALVPSLKRRGHRLIYLVRGINPQQRVRSCLGDWVTEDDRFWSGDVTRPLAGVGAIQANAWRGQIDHVVHLAGSIKFDEKLAEETHLMNVDGTRHVLDLADKLGSPTFHHMSTVYVAGDEEVFTEDDLDCGQHNFNAYERSKLEAEKVVQSWSGKARIYRMSIMVGDSRTGEISAFNGYYGFLQPLWRLLLDLRAKWQSQREKLMRSGIWFNRRGQLFIPLIARCSLTSRLNLIPTDWLVETMAELIVSQDVFRVFHLVHPDSSLVQWAIEESLKCLGIVGLKYGDVPSSFGRRSSLGVIQRRLDRGLGQFLPYVTHSSALTCDHVIEALGDRYCAPPPVDTAFLATILDYAVSNNFGQRSLVHA